MNKKDLRRMLKTRLSSMSDEDQHQYSLLVSANLKKILNDHDVIQKHLVIGVFAPIEQEPQWFLLMDEFKDIQTAYPAIADEKMIFKLARMSDLVIDKAFGVDILGPGKMARSVTPDLIIVPGLGFTKDGKRLGRGKGFYDKYLEKSSAVKIGIAFEAQVLEDIPTDAHDVIMDFVVTDKDIYTKNS